MKLLSFHHWPRAISLTLPILLALAGCQSVARTTPMLLPATAPPTETHTPSTTPSPTVPPTLSAEAICPTTDEGTIEPQCQALVAIYQATDGEHWTRSDGWLSSQPICTWYGVTCTNDQVTELRLSNNLQGKLPAEIDQLASLQVLDLGPDDEDRLLYNRLIGIPLEIGELANLRKLDLSENQIPELPPEIGQLANLQVLDVNSNMGRYVLPMKIPREIGQLVNLQILNLGYNALTELPSEIGRLANLEELYLYGNRDLRELPPEIGQLTNLKMLDLVSTDVTKLPPEICNLPNLQIPPGLCK